MLITDITHNASWLNLQFSNGSQASYLASWLRDNVAVGRHQSGGQRTFDINLIDPVTISGANLEQGQVKVNFDGHEPFFFDPYWLSKFSQREIPGAVPGGRPPIHWGSEMQSQLPWFDYQDARTNQGVLADLLESVLIKGFVLLDRVPSVPETVLDVVDLFGFVRVTNYGALFDVRVKPNPANLAFTSQTIGMHTDNPYRDPVPGLQLLHCLINDSDGGENQLVDGFAVASQMQSAHPDAFQMLLNTPVEFRYFEPGLADLCHRTPLITVRDGLITEVRYNARSIQTIDVSATEMASFYEAYRIFGQALHNDSAKVEFRLEPGQMMIFDNQRVLHGRSSYGEGERHLQGCYADKDSLRSTLRLMGRS